MTLAIATLLGGAEAVFGLRERLRRRRAPSRYLRSVMASQERYAGAPALLVRHEDQERPEGSNSKEEGAGLPLLSFAPVVGTVHLIGASGSGKSWSVGRFIYKVAQAESARRMGFGEGAPSLPVYVRAGAEHVLDGLGQFLQRHGFYQSAPTRDRIRDLLAAGGLTVIVDDVHLLLESDDRRRARGLDELIGFADRNRVVLAGRPHVARDPYGVRQVVMAPLDMEKREAVVRYHLGEQTDADYKVQVIESAAAERGLAATPQALQLMTVVVPDGGRFPDDHFALFREVFRRRFESARDHSAVAIDDVEIAEAIVGSLAMDRLRMGVYEFSLADARRATGEALRGLGPDVTAGASASDALDGFLLDGFLVQDSGLIRFEHDRWHEFFTASHVLATDADVGDLESDTAFEGVSRFLAWTQPPIPPATRRPFWTQFWDRLAERDLSFALRLSEAVGVPGSVLVGASVATNDEGVREGYAEFLGRYRSLLGPPSGALRSRIPPAGDGAAGVVVARQDAASARGLFRGHWLGFREVGADEDDVVIDSSSDASAVKRLSEVWGAEGVSAWVPDPAEAPPMRAALRVWSGAVDRAIRDRMVVEPPDLILERAYYGLIALAVAAGIEVSAEEGIPHDVAQWLVGQNRLRGTLSEPIRMGRRWSRIVAVEDVRSDLAVIQEQAAKQGVVRPPIWPPLPPNAEFDAASPTHPRNDQILDYYRRVYAAVGMLADLNLPTLAGAIREAVGFPLRVVVLTPSGSTSGFNRSTFYQVVGQQTDVVVQEATSTELETLRNDLGAKNEVQSDAIWPGTVEPIRRRAYELFESGWNRVRSR